MNLSDILQNYFLKIHFNIKFILPSARNFRTFSCLPAFQPPPVSADLVLIPSLRTRYAMAILHTHLPTVVSITNRPSNTYKAQSDLNSTLCVSLTTSPAHHNQSYSAQLQPGPKSLNRELLHTFLSVNRLSSQPVLNITVTTRGFYTTFIIINDEINYW
jgi:hypothetical protein